MDLQSRLAAIVEAIAPGYVSDPTLREFTNGLLEILQSPNRSVQQLNEFLATIKRQLNIVPQYEPIWKMFEGIIFPLLSMNDRRDVNSYLDSSYARLQETLQSMGMSSSSQSLPAPFPSRGRGYTLNRNTLRPGGNYINFNENLLTPSVYAESFETLDRISDRGSIVSSHWGSQINERAPFVGGVSMTLKNRADPYYTNTVPEEDILGSISYNLLGITSDLFPLEGDTVTIPYNVPNAMSGRIHLLLEAGLIYKSLSQQVDYYKRNNISPLRQTVIVELSNILNSYSEYVNTLLRGAHFTSLTGLYIKLYPSVISLRICYYFMADFETQRGDQFLSLLHPYLKHGDETVRTVATRLYHCMLSQYFQYLKKWLTLGEIDRTYTDEFFIQEFSGEETGNLLPFKFDTTKIPQFLSHKIAEETYMVGKSFRFLATYCQELAWTNALTKKYVQMYDSLSFYTSDFASRLSKVVREEYSEIVEYCNKVLSENFYYYETIQTVKNILLMGRGDLIDALLSSAKDFLDQPMDKLQNHMFTKVLQEAVQKSSMRNYLNKFDNNVLINRLDARILHMGRNLPGWDVFTLDYVVPPPLSIVLNVNREDGRKEYLQIFNFLWKFKKIDYFSQSVTLPLGKLMRSFKNDTTYNPLSKDISKKLSKIMILISQLQQFNLKLENYYNSVIIEKCFTEFIGILQSHTNDGNTNIVSKSKNLPVTTSLSDGSITFANILKPKGSLEKFGITDTLQMRVNKLNIDELDDIHNDFLKKLLSHKLFASTTEGRYSRQPYSMSVLLIFEEMLEVLKCCARLYEVATELYPQINQPQSSILENHISLFNATSRETVVRYKRFREVSTRYIMDLKGDGDVELGLLGSMLM